jgi:hypothetical protein
MPGYPQRMAGRDEFVRTVLDRCGQTFAEEAGIRVADRPGPVAPRTCPGPRPPWYGSRWTGNYPTICGDECLFGPFVRWFAAVDAG